MQPFKTEKEMRSSPTTQVKSLTRGLVLLEKIAQYPYGIALNDLSLQVGLPNSTAHRLLMTMQQHGLVVQFGDLGHWRIGVKTFTIGSAFFRSRDIVNIAQPLMFQLMEEVGETVNLLVFDRISWQPVVIGQVQCNELMRMVASIGGHLPMHASGGGKVMLASLSETERVKIIQKRGLTKYTDKTIDAMERLNIELDLVKKQGYSVDDEEHAIGLRCVAAPIFDESKTVYASVSISGPKSRVLDSDIVHLGSLVSRTAEQISVAYGYVSQGRGAN